MTRGWWLLRQLEADKTLVFQVTAETYENSESPGHYLAELKPLEEGTVIGAGDSLEVAEANVLNMFKEMADHCIEHGILHELVGDTGIGTEMNHPIDFTLDVIRELERRRDAAGVPAMPPPWLTMEKHQPEPCQAFG